MKTRKNRNIDGIHIHTKNNPKHNSFPLFNMFKSIHCCGIWSENNDCFAPKMDSVFTHPHVHFYKNGTGAGWPQGNGSKITTNMFTDKSKTNLEKYTTILNKLNVWQKNNHKLTLDEIKCWDIIINKVKKKLTTYFKNKSCKRLF
jgi:hypothetical protein